MRILWLVDYTIKEVPAGGAEITDSYIIEAGRKLGHSIEVVRPSDLRTDCLSRNDIAIFSNCYDFHKTAINAVIEKLPYVVYSHDSGRWMSVIQRVNNFLNKSICNIFLSPLHRDCFKDYFNETVVNLLVPPYIPISFYDKGLERSNKIMFVGNIHEGKGVPQIIKYAEKNQHVIFDFYFNRASNHLESKLKRLRNCNLVGYVGKDKIFDNYNTYKYFIHIPAHKEAFGRAVAEALLCGCKLISNDNIGILSYKWDYSTLREQTFNGNFLFWTKLEEVLSR